MSKFTRRKPARKPRVDFPLFPHQTGRWAKKVRGKLCYFGKTADDPKGTRALARWLAERDDLLAGRTPRPSGDGLIMMDLVNQFLTRKRHLVDTREITPRTFADYYAACERVSKAFGLRRLLTDTGPDDFAAYRRQMAKTWGPVGLANEIQRVRSLFKFGHDEGMLASPVRFGQGFNRPSKKTLRLNRAAKGPKLLDAAAIRAILDNAGTQLRATILLGLNCGFGNSDVGNLPLSALQVAKGWIYFPRPKTGIDRRCPLWPETVEAVEKALAARPKPKDEAFADRVFITKYGHPWTKIVSLEKFDNAAAGETTTAEKPEGKPPRAMIDDPTSKEFQKILKALGLKKPGFGFYTLRHTFATIAGKSRDQVAVNYIMGHVDDSMAAVYREQIDDDQLQAVVGHVHTWLFGSEGER